MTTTTNLLTLIARILIAFIFVMSAITKLLDFNSTVAYMTHEGIPLATISASIAILLELVGGLMILLGWHARLGAIIIILFVLAVTFVIHDFWTYPQTEMQNQMHHFMKNFAILGGVLYVFCFGPGEYSFDQRRLTKKL